uniref:EF-hand domain-containing protein n=1 Tax=Acrobeloides nanus TaxID=290746 RepID=A0A914D7A6_9BILA
MMLCSLLVVLVVYANAETDSIKNETQVLEPIDPEPGLVVCPLWMLHYIPKNQTEKKIVFDMKVFQEMDENHDGILTVEEANSYVEKNDVLRRGTPVQLSFKHYESSPKCFGVHKCGFIEPVEITMPGRVKRGWLRRLKDKIKDQLERVIVPIATVAGPFMGR